jgi:FkbM family methyltransferase
MSISNKPSIWGNNMLYKKIHWKLNRLGRSLRSIIKHPLTQDGKLSAIKRYIVFHVCGWLYPGLSIYNFVGPTRFVARPGMAGIVGNIYKGLADFQEGGFLMHLLREGDLFVDIGANVGVYAILAAGVCGVKTIAIEPIPTTVEMMELNLRINNLNNLVKIIRRGVGSTNSYLYFTHKEDDLNRVVLHPTHNEQETLLIKVEPLDNIIGSDRPSLLKIDVEGFELEVLKGAPKTIQQDNLLAIIIEMHVHEGRYGFNYEEVHNILIDNNFYPFSYNPFTRQLIKLNSFCCDKFNTIYLRDVKNVMERLSKAKPFNVLKKSI